MAIYASFEDSDREMIRRVNDTSDMKKPVMLAGTMALIAGVHFMNDWNCYLNVVPLRAAEVNNFYIVNGKLMQKILSEIDIKFDDLNFQVRSFLKELSEHPNPKPNRSSRLHNYSADRKQSTFYSNELMETYVHSISSTYISLSLSFDTLEDAKSNKNQRLHVSVQN